MARTNTRIIHIAFTGTDFRGELMEERKSAASPKDFAEGFRRKLSLEAFTATEGPPR
ncbi:hypothetical protein OG266_41385 [Streptomyces sp. NBC_00554]|uniref:hypothetical protein n=1 Tax=unclassified Streptomyces TaxID=2593676 RepID=UPI0022502BA1|nr:hypothetical protein [Streptomyces sp. NBC_00620]MCX4976811.1 hypothetical protein [Streptomyces sp. NBC_00620]WUC54458.1 hypothetical protein OG266_41385 [Streptomyces sp. NBC_00554]